MASISTSPEVPALGPRREHAAVRLGHAGRQALPRSLPRQDLDALGHRVGRDDVVPQAVPVLPHLVGAHHAELDVVRRRERRRERLQEHVLALAVLPLADVQEPRAARRPAGRRAGTAPCPRPSGTTWTRSAGRPAPMAVVAPPVAGHHDHVEACRAAGARRPRAPSSRRRSVRRAARRQRRGSCRSRPRSGCTGHRRRRCASAAGPASRRPRRRCRARARRPSPRSSGSSATSWPALTSARVTSKPTIP